MTQEELDQGSSFVDAVRDFLAWAGGGAQFCTWGTVDLVELQRNMKYHGVLSLLKGPLHYYDVQKLFAVNFEDMKSRRSLEYGIDYLKLEKKAGISPGSFRRLVYGGDFSENRHGRGAGL